MKRCAKCGSEKPLEGFYRRYTKRGNVGSSYCKECIRRRAKAQHRRERAAKSRPHDIPK